MLAKINRIASAAEFRIVGRKGRRVATADLVVSVLRRNDDSPSRFGFIVPNTVGSAPVRNRVKRQLREVSAEILASSPVGIDVLVRAKPTSAGQPYQVLQSQLKLAVSGKVARNVA